MTLRPGLLPEDPDDPPKMTWRELLVIVPAVVLLTGVHQAIPDDWAFWQSGAAYLATAAAVAVCVRLWAERVSR
jgi:hypothetical protein